MFTWIAQFCWFIARVRHEAQEVYVSTATLNNYKRKPNA